MYDFVTAFFCFGISWFSYFYYLQRVVILRGNHLGIIDDVCGNIILRVLGVKTLHILSVILHWNLRQLFLWITINCTKLTKGGGTFFLLLVVVIFLFLFNFFIKQHHASLFILLIFYIILWYLVYKLFGLQSTLNLLLFNFFKKRSSLFPNFISIYMSWKLWHFGICVQIGQIFWFHSSPLILIQALSRFFVAIVVAKIHVENLVFVEIKWVINSIYEVIFIFDVFKIHSVKFLRFYDPWVVREKSHVKLVNILTQVVLFDIFWLHYY